MDEALTVVVRVVSNDVVAAEADAQALNVETEIPFACECPDVTCRAFVTLTLGRFHELRLDGLAVIARSEQRDRSASG